MNCRDRILWRLSGKWVLASGIISPPVRIWIAPALHVTMLVAFLDGPASSKIPIAQRSSFRYAGGRSFTVNTCAASSPQRM
jgi:hypothetical protein